MMPQHASASAPGVNMPQPHYFMYGSSAAGMPYPNAPYPSSGSVYPDASGAAYTSVPSYPAASGGANIGFGLPTNSHIGANSVGMGAVFKKRLERIDWRKIASLDVDRITRDMDVQSLQENLMNITFCSLETEVDCRNMDPNFVKLFKVAQLSIEYMLYSQEYLANVMAGLESRLGQVMLDHESTRQQVEKQRQELIQVKKESHKRKKLLAAQQQILHSGAQAYHKCPFCPKAFVHESYCASHIQRRHPDQVGSTAIHQSAPVSPQRSDHVTSARSRLEQELWEVKERLRVTERHLEESERIKIQSMTDLNADEQQRLMESWKLKEKERQRGELESVRQMFLNQFEDLNDKYMESERQLMKLRGKNETGGAVSNLGDLADDTDTETDRTRVTRNASIRNLLSPERSLKDQMDTQTFTIEQRNQQEIARLDAVLKSSRPAISPPVSQPNTPKTKRDVADSPVEEMMTHESAATAAAGLEMPLLSKHNDLIKTAPPSSIAMKRSLSPGSPGSPSSPVTSPRSGSPAKRQNRTPGGRAVYDKSDDDIDDDEESELQEVKQEFTMWTNEEEMKGALSQSTLNSTGPGDDRLGTDESLIATSVRNSRLSNQLHKDPGLLKGLREELNQVLDEQLEEKGITKDLNGISNVVLNNKLEAMEKDREIMDRKYANFRKIRRQYERKVDREARLKWEEIKDQMKRETRRGPKSSKSSSLPNLAPPRQQSPSHSPAAARRSPAKKPSQVPRSPRSPVVIRKESSSPAPQAPPRASTTLSTEYSSTQDTQDDYTDSDGEYTDDETEGVDEVDSQNRSDVRQSQPEPRLIESQPGPRLIESQPGPRLIMSGPAVPPRTPEMENVPTTPKTPRDEISDWDSTEMSEAKPTVRANVRELSKSVDSQLKHRSPGERPFGGVNTLPTSQSNGRHVRITAPEDEEDDDLSISVSSILDLKPVPAPAPRKGVHASADGEFSTNTGGTSVWGSVSKAPGAPLVGVGKSSQSLTDWDSDLDLDDL